MKSIVLEQPKSLNIIEKPKPVPTGDEVLVRIKYGGICGSDIHAYQGSSPFIVFPRVLGHELIGVVEEVKNSKSVFKPGDRVLIDPVFSCGNCYACRVGRHNVCKEIKVFGVHMDGGYQDYVTISEKKLFKLPDKLDFKLGALGEPLSIGFEANSRAEVNGDDTVVIIGAGTIGLMTAIVSKYLGAEVICLDLDNNKLELAHKLGVDHMVNVEKDDPLEKVMEITEGEGASVVIEAVGIPQTIQQSLTYVSAAGRVVVLGLVDKDVPISIVELFKKEVDFLGSRLNNNMFPKVVELLKDENIDLSPLKRFIKIYQVDDVEKGFIDKIDQPEISIKSLIEF